MKKIRLVILPSVLITVLFASAGLGTGACGGGMNGMQDTGSSYEGPVSIPVTIAKDVTGIDATTLVFTQAVADPNKVGTITFNTINRTPTCQTVNVFIDGALDSSLAALSDECGYAKDVSLTQVDKPIAFTAQDLDSLDNSEPTLVQIIDTTDLYDPPVEGVPQYIMQVSVTNMASDTATATADVSEVRAASMTIFGAGASISEERRLGGVDNGTLSIVFAAESDDGIYLYSQLVTGGTSPEVFSDALPAFPLGLFDISTDMIYFLDPNGTFYSLAPDGSYTNEFELYSLVPPSEEATLNQSFFSVTEGGYVIYKGEMQDGTPTPMLAEMIIGGSNLPCHINGASWTYASLEVAFADNDTILVAALGTDGTYRIFHFSLVNALSNVTETEYVIEPEDMIESTTYLGSPVAGTDSSNRHYFLCAGDDDLINLCRESGGTLETIVSLGIQIVKGSVSMSYASDYLLFSLDTDPVVSCYYTIASGETSCRIMGSHPFPLHTSDGEVVGYISTVSGYPQIAIENPANVFGE